MKKIPSLFARDSAGNLTDEYHPAAFWVVNGEGIATRKFDGTAVRYDGSALWARYDAKRGKPLPDGFVAVQEPDPITGHHPGWVPAQGPQHKWINVAFEAAGEIEPWTYEACGPKINGNKEKFDSHVLVRHGDVKMTCPRDKAGLIEFFKEFDVEGIVWWRDRNDPDCDKVKITGAALGVKRR